MVSIENGPNIASPASSSASVRRPGTRALTGQLLRQAQGPGVRPREGGDGGGTARGTCGGRRVGRKEARRNSRGGRDGGGRTRSTTFAARPRMRRPRPAAGL